MKPRMIMAILFCFTMYQQVIAGENIHIIAGNFDPLTQVKSLNSEEILTQYYILQFHNSPTPKNFEELKSQNVKWLAYLPDDALIVKLPNTLLVKNIKLTQLRAAFPYMSEFKIHPSLKKVNIFNKTQKKIISIKAFDDQKLPDIAKKIENIGGYVFEAQGHYLDVYLALKDLQNVSQWEGIEFIQEKAEVEFMTMPFAADFAKSNQGDYSDLSGYESGAKIMNFPEAWSKGLHGEGQIVAMADTGLDSGDLSTVHRDFAALTHGYTYGLFSKSWYDPMGHGTHVAGSVVSSGLASGNQLKGGAYNAKFIAQGMWSDKLKNLSIPPSFSKFLQPAYNDGARVHTNSWGNSRNLGSYDSMAKQVDEFMWENPEMLIVFAAGNSGEDSDKDGRIDEGSISSPSTAKNCLTVGASENYLLQGGIQRRVGDLAKGKWNTEPLASDKISDNENGIAVFSSRGPTQDGRLKPDVVAPGTNILSNCSHVKDASPLWGNYNEDYCYSGGTSMSTPLTAGAATVVRQSLVEKGIANPSAAAVKAVLMNTAVDLYPGQFGKVGKSRGQEILSPGPNFHQGYGRVDMGRAVADDVIVFDETQGLQQGQSKNFKVVIAPGAQAVKVHLVYTDRPAASAASKTLVNNLDMDVVLDSGAKQIANDSINNSEFVKLNVNGQKEMSIQVKATRVLDSHQAYALVVSFL
ncbi:MAG: S8 family serine peptidase [Bdellovibrionaceae bacterium]|nr:S8 family serine peptidase [Pseudobdellovibrionaceae bacterium]